jgi:hypothetical protein
VKAWRTASIGIESLVLAESREQARAVTARSACDAGFDVRYTDVRAVRWPKFDRSVGILRPKRCWAPDVVLAIELHGGSYPN